MDSSDMDDELNALLDSAFNDFKNKNNVTIERTNETIDEPKQQQQPSNATANASKTGLIDENDFKIFDEIFNDEKTRETLKQFTNAFSMFGSDATGGNQTQMPNLPTSTDDPTKLFEEFEKMMSQLANSNFDDLSDDDGDDFEDDLGFLKQLSAKTAAAATATASPTKTDSAKATSGGSGGASTNPISQILENMNKQSENLLKNDGGDLFGSAGGSGDDATLMQPLIKMLFSKDILHPSLKMMLENYEKYLADNKADKEHTDEYKNCLKQKVYIIEMCNIYENTGAQDIQSEQLQQILELLEKCGHPPKELVPDVNPFENIGGDLMKNSCPIS